MNREVSSNLQTVGIGSLGAKDKSEHVREVFENAAHYLKNRQVDIRFRIETVRALACTVDWQRLLDIGCGDGSISLQLLKFDSDLTLMDLSENMAELAQQNVPEQFLRNVRVRNENFIEASFDTMPFDLILTVGVMAHVDSPDIFLREIRKLLRPGGSLIVEFTDSRHFVGRIGRMWGCLKEVFAPARYATNKLSFADVAPLFQKNNLELVSMFRYARLPLPGIDKLMSCEFQYRIGRLIFGDFSLNKNACLGNEYICLLTATSPARVRRA